MPDLPDEAAENSQPELPESIYEEYFPDSAYLRRFGHTLIQQAYLDTQNMGLADTSAFTFPLFPQVWSRRQRIEHPSSRPLQQDDFIILVVMHPNPQDNPIVVSPTTHWSRHPQDVQSRIFYSHLKVSPELSQPATFHAAQPTRWTIVGRAYPYSINLREFRYLTEK